MVPFYYVQGNLTMILKGSPVTVSPDHPSFNAIKLKLKDGTDDELLALVNTDNAVQVLVEACPAAQGKAEVRDGEVYYNGQPVHRTIATRIKQFVRDGLPFEHLLRCLEKFEQNPSYSSRLEGYDFLENKGLPICEDGDFFAYKAVTKDYKDKWTGTIDNSIGQTPKMNRPLVDDNRDKECSQGLHVGALDYVGSYGDGDDRLIVVKVNPANIVSVPKGYNCQKMRVCEYYVHSDFTDELTKACYNEQLEPTKVDEAIASWDWCDACDSKPCNTKQCTDTSDDDDEECDCEECNPYGLKPNGYRFYNRRDPNGRFTK